MKTLTRTLTMLLALVIVAGASSCKKEEDGGTGNCNNGTFTATVNGTAFTGSTYQNTLVRTTQSGTKVKRLDIRATAADGKVVILTVTNLEGAANGKCMKVDTYYNDPTQNYSNSAGYEGIIGTYMLNSTTVAGQTMPVPGSQGSITISSCDETNAQVSGTFNFTTSTLGGGSAYTITGTFTNMCYIFSE